jgi:hypothetical protein
MLMSNGRTINMMIIVLHACSLTYSVSFLQNNTKIQKKKTADTVMNIKEKEGKDISK